MKRQLGQTRLRFSPELWDKWRASRLPREDAVTLRRREGIHTMRMLLAAREVVDEVEVQRPMSLTLEIPRITHSLNTILRWHWRTQRRESKHWQDEIYYALRQKGITQITPYPRARVVIDRRSCGELDQDNLTGSVKPVIDALRYAHIIEDDTPAHLLLEVTQTRAYREPPRTRIQIDPIP